MTIDKKKNGDELIIALDGTLDTTSAPELQSLLETEMESAQSITFDFTNVNFISSFGLRVLLHANKTMEEKGGIKIVNTSALVKEVFGVTGFSELLPLD